MIKIENTMVEGWEPAIRGMRNPMNSWDKSDTTYNSCETSFEIGENDLKLMRKLCNGGPDDRKFLRMIVVWVDITAPLYWWKEFDTYKVGTVANSCSTMHKIHAKEFTLDDFSHEHLFNDGYDGNRNRRFLDILNDIINGLNESRASYLDICKRLTMDMTPERCIELNSLKRNYWWQMIQLLPTSYNQRRTVMLNYEVLRNMYHARKNHKLTEWHDFCRWVENCLPYSYELIFGEDPANEWMEANCCCKIGLAEESMMNDISKLNQKIRDEVFHKKGDPQKALLDTIKQYEKEYSEMFEEAGVSPQDNCE